MIFSCRGLEPVQARSGASIRGFSAIGKNRNRDRPPSARGRTRAAPSGGRGRFPGGAGSHRRGRPCWRRRVLVRPRSRRREGFAQHPGLLVELGLEQRVGTSGLRLGLLDAMAVVRPPDAAGRSRSSASAPGRHGRRSGPTSGSARPAPGRPGRTGPCPGRTRPGTRRRSSIRRPCGPAPGRAAPASWPCARPPGTPRPRPGPEIDDHRLERGAVLV